MPPSYEQQQLREALQGSGHSCLRSGSPIGEQLQLESIWLAEMREKSWGVDEGKPDTLSVRDSSRRRWTENEWTTTKGLGAETKLRWARRVYAGMEPILSSSPRQKIIVTHVGTATLVIACWIGMPLEALSRVSFKVGSGNITRLVEDDYFHNHTVTYLNDTTRLETAYGSAVTALTPSLDGNAIRQARSSKDSNPTDRPRHPIHW